MSLRSVSTEGHRGIEVNCSTALSNRHCWWILFPIRGLSPRSPQRRTEILTTSKLRATTTYSGYLSKTDTPIQRLLSTASMAPLTSRKEIGWKRLISCILILNTDIKWVRRGARNLRKIIVFRLQRRFC